MQKKQSCPKDYITTTLAPSATYAPTDSLSSLASNSHLKTCAASAAAIMFVLWMTCYPSSKRARRQSAGRPECFSDGRNHHAHAQYHITVEHKTDSQNQALARIERPDFNFHEDGRLRYNPLDIYTKIVFPQLKLRLSGVTAESIHESIPSDVRRIERTIFLATHPDKNPGINEKQVHN